MKKNLFKKEPVKINIFQKFINGCRRLIAVYRGEIYQEIDLSTYEKIVDESIPKGIIANLDLSDEEAVNAFLANNESLRTIAKAVINTSLALNVKVTAFDQAETAIQDLEAENHDVTVSTEEMVDDLVEQIKEAVRQIRMAKERSKKKTQHNTEKSNKAAFLKKTYGE